MKLWRIHYLTMLSILKHHDLMQRLHTQVNNFRAHKVSNEPFSSIIIGQTATGEPNLTFVMMTFQHSPCHGTRAPVDTKVWRISLCILHVPQTQMDIDGFSPSR